MTHRSFFAALLAAALLGIAISGCSGSGSGYSYRSGSGMIWNTSYNITYKGPQSFEDSVLAALKNVERSVSVFDDASLVSRINRGEDLTVDSIFATVYRTSVLVHKESGGYFDPTLAPLISAYGFGEGEPRHLSQAQLDSVMESVGLSKTSLKGGRLLKSHPGIQFNFSAIAKGFGCDEAGRALRRLGCSDYLVEIGGEIAASGHPDHGGKWNISVDKPIFSRSEVHESMVVIAVTDCGVATSGNYRNFRKIDGKVAGHTIDVTTGRPSQSDMLSATIVAPSCMLADAYATACMAMGSTRAKAMISRLGLAAMLVTADGEVWESDGFKKLII